ncbi:hypothetical protein O7626_40570 [Micromonospora sp. WMMD1102]|uniref:hypothetical protein n=1 Tax=Micromonospora sp. WMMD1102 TaxID=3016105 RepID=UPI0024155FB8|nr:hypothetical protein [Micromonospora sp. WMMD1102]MDG4792112.1 hypothetical protein [Micromonospora sp. WMMD1102]
MFTTATLSIGGFYTDLKLTGDNHQPGAPAERINVLGDGADDWRDRDNSPYFKRGADRELTARGWRRVGGWVYDAPRDVYVAPIANEGRR